MQEPTHLGYPAGRGLARAQVRLRLRRVKLLLDENLSRRLASALEPLYPGSAHVCEFGLERAGDEAVWRHAREHGFAIVTKDADFAERSLAEGPPPKVV